MPNGFLPLLSLFSGAGGLDLGFESEGFRPLLAIDSDLAAVETYNWNRKRRHPARLGDLKNLEASEIIDWWEQRTPDVVPVGVIGGPPCQPFSQGNSRKRDDDPRAELAFCYAKLLKAFNERWNLQFFLFENSAGLGLKRHAEFLQRLERAFQEAGFRVVRFFLEASEFGVPQYRRRMFILGVNDQRYGAANFIPPIGRAKPVLVQRVIRGLVEPMFFERRTEPGSKGLHPNHWCMNPKSPRFTDGSLLPGQIKGRSFRRLDWESPSWTVAYGHREVHIHPNGTRRLSVYEAMLLQSLPRRGYELRGNLSDQIRLVSDLVPLKLARALAKELRLLLTSAKEA